MALIGFLQHNDLALDCLPVGSSSCELRSSAGHTVLDMALALLLLEYSSSLQVRGAVFNREGSHGPLRAGPESSCISLLCTGDCLGSPPSCRAG